MKYKSLIYGLSVIMLLTGCADIDYALKGYHVVAIHDGNSTEIEPAAVNVVFDRNANQLPMCVNSKPIAEVSVPTYDLWGGLYDRETITYNFKKAASAVGGNHIVNIVTGVNDGDGSLMLVGYALNC
ncbi:hypothetical protein OAO18_00650 [Francisellaceae bacterium]|nr:hypothetical protein [Francisellaceae bacterium]